MPKGYWIVRVTVHDRDAFEKYRQANAVALNKFGARFQVRGGEQEIMEGNARPRTIVLEFPTIEDARACYFSPEYKAARVLRDDPAVSAADFVIVQGYDG